MNANIWDGIDTLICDLDGVVYLGDDGVAGAGSTLEAVGAAGIDVVFVTNNSTKTPDEVAAKIASTTGYPADPDTVVTSAVVTADRLRGKAATAIVVGGSAVDAALTAVGIETTTQWEQADAVVVGLDMALSYEKLAAATLAIRNGALFYATNTDSTYPTPQGLLPGGGAMVAALETAGGVSPTVSGKPESAMLEHIAARSVGNALVVGDRPETDIALARRAGWSSVLVLSGATRSLEEVAAEHAPDLAMASLADLGALLPYR